MNRKTGRNIIKQVGKEKYSSYVPFKLPPGTENLDFPLDLTAIYSELEKATKSLAELNQISSSIPNMSLFIYMYVRKEALLSSQIEGTQSSLSDLMLFEHNQKTETTLEDVEEVSNYVKAINYGLSRIKEGFPLSIRLIKEIHQILLSGARGARMLPGEIRRSQNWIGGTRPGNALFVPPPVEYLNECLSDLEIFMHDDTLPVLIKVGLIHAQFETIHPFLDGNGRLGRLLISLLLCNENYLNDPVLYLSLYLKKNRQTYYDLLGEVRHLGKWEVWLEFFLQAIESSSKEAINSVKEINALFEKDLSQINKLGRIRFSCEEILEFMKKLPKVTAPLISKELKISAPTARSALNKMTILGILQEVSGKKRDKVYVYGSYLEIIERGAQ